jgi:hypothetical protein
MALGLSYQAARQSKKRSARRSKELQHNNSFNPTLASESVIIKFGGFWYLVCDALASVGLIRALGGGNERELKSRVELKGRASEANISDRVPMMAAA